MQFVENATSMDVIKLYMNYLKINALWTFEIRSGLCAPMCVCLHVVVCCFPYHVFGVYIFVENGQSCKRKTARKYTNRSFARRQRLTFGIDNKPARERATEKEIETETISTDWRTDRGNLPMSCIHRTHRKSVTKFMNWIQFPADWFRRR